MNKLNHQITAQELRIIDEAGENVGVMSLPDALKLAQQKGLDLVEIAPTAKPPVAKIISYDKYRYQEEKKLKKQRASEKTMDLRQVRISGRAAQHDLEIKAKKANEFLAEGDMVEIQLAMRGREKANKDWAREKLLEFVRTMVNPDHKVISEPKFGGRGFNMKIVKK
ncbi:MAG: translation initiation factor IF-3 [Patescibacteria group bacterium]|nr:translation initiation factor IF-3 [Patescibacteria group bacterium]